MFKTEGAVAKRASRRIPWKLMLAGAFVACAFAWLLFTVSASRADVENSQSSNGGTVTKVRINGHFAQVNLSDGGYAGFLTVARDQITGTTALDFSFVARDPDNPHIAFLWQGAGEIPNSAFTTAANGTSAQLAVTTPFPVTLVVIDQETGSVTIIPWTPMTFDLTWEQNSFITTFERVEAINTFGPLRTYFTGTFSSVSASVNGTWDGHTATGSYGTLQDTHNNSVQRVITIDPNP